MPEQELPEAVAQFCEENGYTEPFFQEGCWWGFAPQAHIPVQLEQKSVWGRSLVEELYPAYAEELRSIGLMRTTDFHLHLNSHSERSPSERLRPLHLAQQQELAARGAFVINRNHFARTFVFEPGSFEVPEEVFLGESRNVLQRLELGVLSSEGVSSSELRRAIDGCREILEQSESGLVRPPAGLTGFHRLWDFTNARNMEEALRPLTVPDGFDFRVFTSLEMNSEHLRRLEQHKEQLQHAIAPSQLNPSEEDNSHETSP